MTAPVPARALDALPTSYVMEVMRAKRRELESRGVRVLDLSVGEPELAPDPIAREALRAAAEYGTYNRYPPHPGTPQLREAMAAFYERRYGLRVDPHRQILPLLGTKEGIVHLATAFADSERPVYIGDVSYPLYGQAAALAGAPVVQLPGGWDDNYVPRFPDRVDREGGIAFVGSPANPTGATFGAVELRPLVEACRRRRTVLCFDAAYVEIRGSAEPAVLPLPLVGDELVVELHSLSKSFSLAGWRIGFAVGDPAIIAGLARIKSVVDSGMPMPQQLALARLLEQTTDDMLARVRSHYTQRQRQFRAAVAGLPLEVFPSDASMFCWTRSQHSGEAVCSTLADHGVLAIPGGAFGPGGTNCVRFSTAVSDDVLAELPSRLARALTP